MFGSGAQTRGTVNGSSRATSTSASVRKTPATSFGDDLSDLFGGISFLEVVIVTLRFNFYVHL